jgi:hypothetical protein
MPSPDLRPYYIQRQNPTIDGKTVNPYFPSLEVLFPSLKEHKRGTPTLAASELILDVSGSTATVENLITKEISTKPVWIRRMHLLEPVDVMSGDYILPSDGALPTFREAWQQTLRKVNDPYNEAYTASVASCLTSRLAELDLSPHFCQFYGAYTGRVSEYRFNITEDLYDIENEPWFHAGLQNGAFRIVAIDPDNQDVEGPYEPWTAEPPVNHRDYGEEEESLNSESESESESATLDRESIGPLEEADVTGIEDTGEVTMSRPRLRLERSNALGPETHSQTDSDQSMLDYAVILKDFPIQYTVLEKCDGTMDALMDAEHDKPTEDMIETKDARWTAWIFQVVAALTVAQQHFDLIHNDLHTNNIVWTGTGETHLYYKIHGASGGDRIYKVPTYGRLFKIIDYGRATFRVPQEKGSGPTWFPDVYAPANDAGGQYNCGEFFDKSKPKVSPNKSFDLCRMAVAMLDAVWPSPPADAKPARVLTKEPGRSQNETVSPIWNTLWLWLTDKEGKNILKLPNGRERYPEFDLYCAIAATSDNAVPAQQLTLPVFDGFKIRPKDVPPETKVWGLQAQIKTKQHKKNPK